VLYFKGWAVFYPKATATFGGPLINDAIDANGLAHATIASEQPADSRVWCIGYGLNSGQLVELFACDVPQETRITLLVPSINIIGDHFSEPLKIVASSFINPKRLRQ
jgi:hypothetical protein